MSPHNKESVYMLPNEILLSKASKLLRLKNPHTKISSYFLLDQGESLYEVQGFDESFRSWFIKENVYSDGCIKMAIPYNSLFLILPYLIQATKNIPLDQLLEDDDFPAMPLLSDIVKDLSRVADRIGPPSLNVWSYNEKSTFEWLSEKVDKLSQKLDDHREKPSLTSSVASDKDSYRPLAFGIISEYLSEELGAKLKSHLKFPEPEKVIDTNGVHKKAKLKEEQAPEPAPVQAKKTPVVKQSAKSKALAKSAKGSKSITSFFFNRK